MGLFGRRRASAAPADGHVRWVATTAQELLAVKGVQTNAELGGDLIDAALILPDGRRFPIYNLVAMTQGTDRETARLIIERHVGMLLDSGDDVDPSSMDPEELRTRLRARILPRLEGEDRLTYGRPFADDLIVALCLDLPQTVVTLSDEHLDALPLSVDEMFEIARLNTEREPIDDRIDLEAGIQLVGGESLFIASKATTLRAVTGDSPHGTVFALPHRHVLLTLPVVGQESMLGIQELVSYVRGTLQSPVPGGPISSNLYFEREGRITRISETTPDGSISIFVNPDLQSALAGSPQG